MNTIIGFIAFFALMAAQLFAVVFVQHDATGNQTADTRYDAPDQARTRNIWLSA